MHPIFLLTPSASLITSRLPGTDHIDHQSRANCVLDIGRSGQRKFLKCGVPQKHKKQGINYRGTHSTPQNRKIEAYTCSGHGNRRSVEPFGQSFGRIKKTTEIVGDFTHNIRSDAVQIRIRAKLHGRLYLSGIPGVFSELIQTSVSITVKQCRMVSTC